MSASATRVRPLETALTLLVIVALVVGALVAQRPPRPRSATAPAATFSAERAFAHVEAVARVPHAIGTPENQAVRDHLLAALADLGLDTEVQRSTAVSDRFATVGVVENVLGRWPGTDTSGAVLLVAHYDSVTTAPGAADNGAAVAAVLEALRALRAGPPLRNDLLVLFSDGEEVGLLGAEAFAAEHPWMDDVALVVNLEARGSGGPSVLVETRHGNAALIRAFAATVPYPNASSLAFEVYDVLPNDTDFSVFKDLGVAGYNFAFIRRAAHYHATLDAPTQLELASLQHHGEHLLALAGHFGQADLADPAFAAGGDAVYIDVLRRFVVHYPAAWALPLALLATVLWFGVVAWGRARRHVRLRGVAAGFVWLLLALAGAVGAALAISVLLGRLQPALANPWMAASYRPEATMVGFALTTLLVTLVLAVVARRWWRPSELGLGALAGWVALGIAVAVVAPGGSYLLLWPTLTMLAAVAVTTREGAGTGDAGARAALLLAGALPGLLWLPPFVAEGFYAVGLPLAGAVVLLVALGGSLLVPLVDTLWGPRGGGVALVLLAATAGAFALGARQAGYDARQPRPTNAFYVVDPARAEARFVSLLPEADAWTASFIVPEPVADRPPLTSLQPDAWELRHGPAPVLALQAPRLGVVADEVEGDRRTITLRLASARPATRLSLLVHPEAPVDGVTVDGRSVARLQRPNGWTRLTVFGPMEDGVTVAFTTAADARLELVVTDETHDLLEVPGLAVPPRPADAMPVPSRLSDAVLVTSRWLLPAPE